MSLHLETPGRDVRTVRDGALRRTSLGLFRQLLGK
jgi:hypothetical protein